MCLDVDILCVSVLGPTTRRMRRIVERDEVSSERRSTTT